MVIGFLIDFAALTDGLFISWTVFIFSPVLQKRIFIFIGVLHGFFGWYVPIAICYLGYFHSQYKRMMHFVSPTSG